VFSQSDDYTGTTMVNSLIPKEFKLEKKEPIIIEKQVIIGASSMVMPGVTIAEGCSIGAMSLVTKSTQPWGMYLGIPAKRFKERKMDLCELEKKFLQSLDENVNDFI
jgi:acetyltransferase-like isoleucine patch superfamily enzyme